MTTESKKMESTIEGKVNQNIVDESDGDDEEVYEPNFDEDEDEQQTEQPNKQQQQQQLLNRSKPSMPLNQVNEEVKEMKSVDEEDSSQDDGMGINL